MKKQLVPVIMIAVLSYFNTAATPVTPSKENTVQVVVKESFNRIVVCNNVNVVLVDEASQNFIIKGKAKWCEAVKLEVKAGVLTVSSGKRASISQPTVYIPVQQLEAITVTGYSDVESMGTLHSAKLNIRIEGECKVNVVNSGPVVVSNGPEHGFDYVSLKKL